MITQADKSGDNCEETCNDYSKETKWLDQAAAADTTPITQADVRRQVGTQERRQMAEAAVNQNADQPPLIPYSFQHLSASWGKDGNL